MGKLPFFTRVEVYEGAYVILKFNGMEESLSPNEAKGGQGYLKKKKNTTKGGAKENYIEIQEKGKEPPLGGKLEARNIEMVKSSTTQTQMPRLKSQGKQGLLSPKPKVK